MAKEDVMAPIEENLAKDLFMDLRMSKANVMFKINGTITLNDAMKNSFLPDFFVNERSVLTPEMNRKYMKPINPMLLNKKLMSSGNIWCRKFLLWLRTDGPMMKPPRTWETILG